MADVGGNGGDGGAPPGREPDPAVRPSPYVHRVRDLADEAREARRTTDVGEEPDPEAALEHARDGLGPVVALYVEAHTGGRRTRFSGEELSLLHRATGDWLTCYARAHGVDHDAEVTVREAAEALLDTHDVTDVARVLTGVPGRGTAARE